MGYRTDGLTFNTLRLGNSRRVGMFKTPSGDLAHNSATGSDWTPFEWGAAVAGEVGELLNELKKVRRGDVSVEEKKAEIASEIADVVIYLDILAGQLGIDMGQAVMATFNRKSEQQSLPVYLHADDWHSNKRLAEEPLGGYHNTIYGRAFGAST